MPFEYDEKWAHIKQIARITRTREIQGAVTKTTTLLITSLTAAQANPERLLKLNKNHWGIENRLHWVRDVVLGEDAAKSRQANAPQNLAALNGFVGHLLFKAFGKFTEGVQFCQRRTSKAIQLLGDFIE
jgi:predicted transposase YbfD/YdcC